MLNKKQFSINGIQQVGVGTCDFIKSRNWFIQHLGFDIKILEDDTVAERMLPYTGGKAQKRHAGIMVNLNGGGGLEIWQYSERKPQKADKEASIGDLGIFCAKVKCRNAKQLHGDLTKSGVSVGPICMTPDGKTCFTLSDLYGNYFQILEDKSCFITQKHLAGGVVGAMIGVSDMEKSIEFYREVLGYDILEYDITGCQKDWTGLLGGEENYRRALLSSSRKAKSAFSELFGKNSIELVQALDRKASKIYDGRYWGDPGFIQLCYDVCGTDALGSFCAEKGYPFTVDSCPDGQIFDMGDASGRFTYIEDPDGTLIEFVETYKVPIAKKLAWYIDCSKYADKTLPKIIFRAMGLLMRLRAN